ncbi:hypothetical protein Syun_004074 [Stephania yunnanensis]|uniref:OCRE domain-containing protein n=1 Tax=Stephania yunnanensis TaxID=152371 RepID=A0AAP0L3V3_9MAGN
MCNAGTRISARTPTRTRTRARTSAALDTQGADKCAYHLAALGHATISKRRHPLARPPARPPARSNAMEEGQPSRSRLKRPFFEDDDSAKQPMQKKVRFPKKKKKAKERGEGVVVSAGGDEEDEELAQACFSNPLTSRVVRWERPNIYICLIHFMKNHFWQDNTNFVEDGIRIVPFNLDQEREEGYFDVEGNFVEYVSEKEIKDAWLDNLEVDPSLAKRNSDVVKPEEEIELSSDDIGKIKRRIASALEPAETESQWRGDAWHAVWLRESHELAQSCVRPHGRTVVCDVFECCEGATCQLSPILPTAQHVLQALKRLKGTSNDKKGRMSEETKLMFDQLTEDAMKLMDNGEYNVYEDKKEVFEREAEGYERLARARDGSSSAAVDGISAESADTVDMFAEDDEIPPNMSSNGNDLGSGLSDESSLPSSENLNTESGDLQNDYVFDETSGYYYSSSSGYYYDPTSRLYCSACTGTWYSYNEQTNVYEEVKEAD